MEDLRLKQENDIKKKRHRKIKWFKRWIYLKKKRWWILLFSILFVIIVFPSDSGLAIGEWIQNFFGNIIKNSGF